MTRWSVRRLFWALPLLPLAAQPAQASSITCYGSIIITSLGTEGIKIEIPDGATITHVPGDMPVPPADDGGNVKPPIDPLSPSSEPLPPGMGATGNPAGGGGSETPSDAPPADGTVEEPTKLPPETEPMPVESLPPVDGPPVVDDIDSPIMTSVPPPGDSGVANTPEPATVTLLALAGLGGFGYARRRRA